MRMDEEVRYWDRLGVYITRQFAEEYIERSQETGITGEYLDNDIEEYQQITTVSPMTLKREVEELFLKPFESVELPPESQVLMDAIAMERNKISIIKGYMADGMDKAEAKEKYTQDMNEMVGEVLGLVGDESDNSEDTPHEEE